MQLGKTKSNPANHTSSTKTALLIDRSPKLCRYVFMPVTVTPRPKSNGGILQALCCRPVCVLVSI